jgi:multicomponent Na+:H+ antiporter subunit B
MSYSLILRTATRLLVSMILVFSVYLLLRGHNAPGGGFSGALVAATGFALYAMVEGTASVRQAIWIEPRWMIVLGMGLAVAAGLGGVLAGRPFMTGLWWQIADVNGTKIALGTPFFFDVGVFAIVLGTILNLILSLEENLEED